MGGRVRHEPFDFTNQWVVPYNPYLLLKYNCHINVEVCSSITAVKYLYKYVYKGHDRALVSVRPMEGGEGDGEQARVLDEVQAYIDGRYLSASEAAWRLFGFEMHEENPSVVRLAVHLPEEQMVYVPEGAFLTAERQERLGRTTLTEWMEVNAAARQQAADHPDQPAPECLTVLYHDFPRLFAWDKNVKRWHRRVNRVAFPPVGRMYATHPVLGERHYLRLLLLHVPGATCYEDLRTTHDAATGAATVHPTFQEACRARGLLAEDTEFHRCMVEAGEYASGHQLRCMFASILAFNEVADPLALYNAHKGLLCEGVVVDGQQRLPAGGQVPPEVEHEALRRLSRILHSMGGRTLRQFNLPVPPADPVRAQGGLVAVERARYNPDERAALLEEAARGEAQLNPAQRQVYDAVLAAVDRADRHMGGAEGHSNVFFIDGLGGAGKTFVYKCLLAKVRGQVDDRGDPKIALSVASSGIAALLLPGGQTAHRQFKLPLKNVSSTSTCTIGRTSELADLIRAASLIVWDEAPMMHRHLFEALDRTLQDIVQPGVPPPQRLPFGGKVVVLGGDFRQVLPVVPRATNQQVVRASLNKSELWQHVRVYRLHENMRVAVLSRDPRMADQAAAQAEFASFVKAVGDGTVPTHPDVGENAICIPPHMCCSAGRASTLQDLIRDVYGGYLQCGHTINDRTQYLVERALLTPLNEDVDMVNQLVAEYFDTMQLPGGRDALAGAAQGPNVAQEGCMRRTYLSSDSVEEQEQVDMYPAEFLHSLNMSGLPPHELHLRVGAPIILLRNLHGGLANGTRLIITKLLEHVLVAKVATGREGDIGREVYLPRLTIKPSDVERMPFTLERRQFPVRPAFAMTINKAQGQTLRMVGIYLPKPVFSHGQLYVALSRVGSAGGVRVLVPDGWMDATQHGGGPGMYTANVVFRDVLLPDNAAPAQG
jgi:hypothetical protein